jgi:hypothetical protein
MSVDEMAQGRVRSNVPAGWIPKDQLIFGIARQDPDTGWEVLLPNFTIAGMGESMDSALVNALELLDDYLVVCAREGMSFEECVRPINRARKKEAISLFSFIAARLRHRPAETMPLVLPLEHALVH